MIARVRFKPAEDWPPSHKWLAEKFAGLVAEIETDTMFSRTECGGRAWKVTEASAEMIERVEGMEYLRMVPNRCWFVCEHIIEIGD